jgi:hypothetical protein
MRTHEDDFDRALEQLTTDTVERLDLRGRALTAEQLAALGAALGRNQRLAALDLRGNALGDVGAKALAEAIKAHPGLTSVDLRDNGVGVEGAMAAAAILGPRAAIVRLNLFEPKEVVEEAIRWSRVATTVEEVERDEPRMEAFRICLEHCRRHEADSLMPPFAMRAEHAQRLAIRIGIRAHLRATPQILDVPVRRPLFILGLFRTGTTLLFNLLAREGSVRAPRLWEMLNPLPPPEQETYESDPRIAEADRRIQDIYQFIPEMRYIHHLDARAPEECAFLLREDYCLEEHRFSQEIPAMAEWLARQDYRDFYRHHRVMLQYLGSRYAPESHWVLKAPFHLWHVPELLDTYPDASLVFTHRDPEQVVASSISLFTLTPRKIWRSYDPKKVGASLLQRLAEGWRLAIRAREAMIAAGKGGQIFDCDYRDIVADPIGVARSIGEHFGRPLTAASEQKMRAYLDDNPKDKYGSHKYALEQFGLTTADVHQAFADYHQYFDRGKGSSAPPRG